jgi:hypothetical protein
MKRHGAWGRISDCGFRIANLKNRGHGAWGNAGDSGQLAEGS